MMIRASNISHSYGASKVLDGISFDVSEGQFIALVGPNGAGKSTLLRTLAGLLRPDEGFSRIRECDPTACGAEIIARIMAYLPQNADVHWPIRVDRLVALGRLPHLDAFHAPKGADELAVVRAMNMADVAHLADRSANTLSGGERARVLLARALAVEAQVLLVDEPVAALDPSHQLDVMDILKRQSMSGGAVVAVLHDLFLAQRFADRVLLMADGKLVADGPVADVLTPQMIGQVYGVACASLRVDGKDYFIPVTKA